MKKLFFIIFLIFLPPFSQRGGRGVIWAQNISSGVAQYVKLDPNTQDGMVVCTSDTGNLVCNRASDPNMIGVVSLSPAASFGVASPPFDSFPVINNGKAYVLVSGENGSIKSGDFITSSSTSGLAVKAIKSGYVLGLAVDSFSGNTVSDTGKILVNIAVRPAVLSTKAGTNLILLIKQGMETAFLTPISSLRYIVAGIIAILSIGYGLSHFGKLAKSGVEAVGRNPLAAKAIQMSVFFNVILTVSVIGLGVAVAYLILSL